MTSVQSSSGNVQFQADGSSGTVDSTLDLSALATFNCPGSSLSVTNDATVQDNSSLKSLTGVAVTLGSGVTIDTSQWNSLTDGSLTINENTDTSFPALNNIDNSSLFANLGGRLTLPMVSNVTSPDTGLIDWFATGINSIIDLPTLGNLNTVDTSLDIDALQGGQVLLPGLTSIQSSSGNVQFEADGSSGTIDSTLDLSALATFNCPGSSLSVTNDATVQDNSSLKSLTGVAVTLGSGVTIDTSQWNSLTDGSLAINENTDTSFPALNNIDNSSLYANQGGNLTLPMVSKFTSPDTGLIDWFATGINSIIDLPTLGNLNTVDTTLDIEALQAGEVLLPGLTSIQSSSGNVQFEADAASSTLELSGLTTFDCPDSSFTVTDGASASLPALAIAEDLTIDVDQGASLVLPAATDLTASGTTATVSNAGSITFGSAVVTMPSSGSDATINVPQLPQGMTLNLESSGAFESGTTINIAQDDTVNLTGGATFNGGVVFNVGQGSTIDLTGGQSLTYSGTLTGSGGGTVELSSGTLTVGQGGLTLNFPSSMFQWTGGELDASSSNATNLGTMNLSGPDEVISNIGTLDNGGTIIETAGPGTSTVEVDGTLNNTGTIEADSGTLDLDPTSISQLSNGALTGGTWNAEDGANLEFPSGTNITSNAGNISLGGSGAVIGGIASLTSNSGQLIVTGGAEFSTAGDFTNSGSLTVGAGSTLTVNGNETQTAASTLSIQIGGTPASGLYGQVVMTGNATINGTFNLELVNNSTPTAGQDYQVMSFASATGKFTTFTGLPPGMTATQSATALKLGIPTSSPTPTPTPSPTPTPTPSPTPTPTPSPTPTPTPSPTPTPTPSPTPTPTPSPTPTPTPLVTVSGVGDVMNKKHQVTEVLVTFSGTVNAGPAQEIRNYRLATPGKRGSFTAKNAGIIKLKAALYDAQDDTVTLISSKPFTLDKPVQLQVNGEPPSGLQDSFGRYIDGAGDGQSGSDAIAVLSRGGTTIEARIAVRLLEEQHRPEGNPERRPFGPG